MTDGSLTDYRKATHGFRQMNPDQSCSLGELAIDTLSLQQQAMYKLLRIPD